jgi:hypothetical protein
MAALISSAGSVLASATVIIVRCASRRDAVPQSGHTQPIEDRLAVAVLRTFGRFGTNLSINAEPMRHMLKDEARNRAET